MDEIAPWEQFVRSTALHHFVYLNEPWLWPTCEIIHYLGLSLLLGTVGLSDLRVLGLAKGIPPATISLAMWVGMLICGRMLTWFRSPFFH
jgi:hypothetical protein